MDKILKRIKGREDSLKPNGLMKYRNYDACIISSFQMHCMHGLISFILTVEIYLTLVKQFSIRKQVITKRIARNCFLAYCHINYIL